jgi:hypothetical protein
VESNIAADKSFGLLCESLMMEERAVEEVLGFKVTAVDPLRLTGFVDAKGVTTVVFDGKPIMQLWPPEVTWESLPDKYVLRLTRKWRRL